MLERVSSDVMLFIGIATEVEACGQTIFEYYSSDNVIRGA